MLFLDRMVFVIQNDDQRLVVDQSRTVLQGDFRLSNNFASIPLISNTYVSDRLLTSAGELATQSSNIVVGQTGRRTQLQGFLYGDGSRLSFDPNILYDANVRTAETWVELSEMAADIPILYANAAVQTSNLANLVSNAVSQSNILYILSTSFSSHEARLIALESMDRTLPDMNRLPSLESANTYYTNILLNGNTLVQSVNVPFFVNGNTMYWSSASIFAEQHGYARQNISTLSDTSNVSFASLYASNTAISANVAFQTSLNGLLIAKVDGELTSANTRNWVAVSALKVSNALVWSNVNALNVSNGLVWSNVNALQTSNTLVWSNVNALNVSNGLVWSNVNALQTSNTLVWSNVNALNVSNGLVWSNVNALNTSNTLVWSNVNALNTSNTLVWSNVNALNTSNTLVWTNVNALETSNGLVWSNVNALNVSNGLVWTNVNALNVSNGLVWSNVNALNVSNGLVWTNVNTLNTSNTLVWSNVNALNTSNAAAWAVVSSFSTGGGFNSINVFQTGTFGTVLVDSIINASTITITSYPSIQTTEKCHFRYTLTQPMTVIPGILDFSGIDFLGISQFSGVTGSTLLGTTLTIGQSGVYSLSLNLPNTTNALSWAGFFSPSGSFGANTFIAVNTQVGTTTHLSCQTVYTGWLQSGDVIIPRANYSTSITLPASNTWFEVSLIQEMGTYNDPYYYNTDLMVHGFSRTFDSSNVNNTIVSGTPVYSTSVYKFNMESLAFTGSTITTSSSPLNCLGFDDCTVEFWINVPGAQTASSQVFTSGLLWFAFSAANVLTVSTGGTLTLNYNEWYHVAFTRRKRHLFTFLNGTLVNTGTRDTTFNSSTSQPFVIGGGTYFMQDIRVTTSYARYTAPFAPAQYPFPDTPENVILSLGGDGFDLSTYRNDCTALVTSNASSTYWSTSITGKTYTKPSQATGTALHVGALKIDYVKPIEPEVTSSFESFTNILSSKSISVSAVETTLARMFTSTATVTSVAYIAATKQIMVGGTYSSGGTMTNHVGTVLNTFTTPTASTAGFMVVLDSSGALVHGIIITNGAACTVNAVASDDSGNWYFGGTYSASGTTVLRSIDGLTTYVTLPATLGGTVGFATKFTNTAIHQWTRIIDTTGADEVLGMAIDPIGAVYVTGFYVGTPSIKTEGNITIRTLPASRGGSTGFLIKFTTEGVFQWARLLDGTTATIADVIRSVACDTIGGIYAVGWYQSSTIILNESGTTLSSTFGGASQQGCIIKFLNDGTFVWATILMPTGSANQINSVSIDPTNTYVIVGGYYTGTSSWRNLTGTTTYATLAVSAGSSAGIVASFDTATGASHRWSTIIDNANADTINSVACDTNNVYIGGQYNGTVIVEYFDGTSQGYQPFVTTSMAGFIMALTASTGLARWSYTYDGTGTTDVVNALACGDRGLFVGGTIPTTTTVVSIYDRTTRQGFLPLQSTSGGFLIKHDIDSTDGYFRFGSYAVDTFWYLSSGEVLSIATYTPPSTVYNPTYVLMGGYVSAAATLRATTGTILYTFPVTVGGTISFIYGFRRVLGTPWLYLIDGGGEDRVRSVCYDTSGNAVIGGFYSPGAATVFKNSANQTLFTFGASTGGTAGFVTKIGSDGNHQWSFIIDGTGADSINAVACDPGGNVYVSGTYAATPSLRSFNGVTTFVTYPASTSGSSAAFVTKLNPSGTHVWSRIIDGAGADTGTSLAVNGTHVVFGGQLGVGTSIIRDIGGATQATFQAVTVISGFTVVLNQATGALVNGYYLTSPTSSQVNTVGIDPTGTFVYIGGQYVGASTTTIRTFNGVTTLVTIQTSGGSTSDGFISKFALTAQTHQWTRILVAGSVNDAITTLTPIGDSVWFGGRYLGTGATLRNESGTTTFVTLRTALSTGSAGVIGLINSDGSTITNIRTFDSSSTITTEQINSIATNSLGDVYVAHNGVSSPTCGIFNGTAQICDTPVSTTFVARLDSLPLGRSYITTRKDTGVSTISQTFPFPCSIPQDSWYILGDTDVYMNNVLITRPQAPGAAYNNAVQRVPVLTGRPLTIDPVNTQVILHIAGLTNYTRYYLSLIHI